MDTSPLPHIATLPFLSIFNLSLVAKGLFLYWCIMTILLMYHWWKYLPSTYVALKATMIYLTGSLLLIGLMFTFA